MNTDIEFVQKFNLAYNAMCKPLCQQLKLPQTAFDILMFFGNNPEYRTASDVVEIRRIKANLVSVNVDKLVREGYLERREAPDDRRKTLLFCTEKAQDVIEKGRMIQSIFKDTLLDGTDEASKEIFFNMLHVMEENMDNILKGMSAAAVISPMLITFLGMDPYMAVGIALSSDVLASAISAYTYAKNKNIDIKNGLIMMGSVLVFTVVGSYISSLVPSATMGNFSVFMTFLLGIKFIVRPVMTTKEAMQGVSAKKRAIQSLVCGMLIGFICGFVGAGGGMMMLLILTSVLGYELKTAVGTSVFIMAFTAFTGAASHFAIGGMPDWTVWLLCVVFTLIWARIAALFANKATPKTLNRVTGVILVMLGIAVMCFNLLA